LPHFVNCKEKKMDIIFYAAIALFIFIKLREQLGRISDAQKEQIADKVKSRQERILRLQNKIQEQIEHSNDKDYKKNSAALVEHESIIKLDDKNKKIINEILSKRKITIEFFMDGAKAAFEMVLKAFAANDKETLEFLLEGKIYEGFEKSIEARKQQNKILNTNLIAIEKAEIISALIKDNIALITVKFTSKQINYFTKENGDLLEGKKDKITQLTDSWTFKKDLNDSNPNWMISATA
jgi:predicted lipid-binding transport protein (Tim44 family)